MGAHGELGHPADDQAVEVGAPEAAVAVVGDRLELPVVMALQDGHVERPAAEVEDQEPAGPRFAVKAVGHRGRHRLGGQRVHGQADHLACLPGGRPLSLAKVRGNRDDDVGHLVAEMVRRDLHHLLEHQAGQFLGAPFLAADHERLPRVQERGAAHTPLEEHGDVIRVDDRLAFGELADLDSRLVILREPHHRRDDPLAVPSGDRMGLARFINEGDDGVGRAKVDADHLLHGSHVRTSPCSVSGAGAGSTSTLALMITSP